MASSEELEGLRSRIDSIDRRILDALAKRRVLVSEVVVAKGSDQPLRCRKSLFRAAWVSGLKSGG